MDYEHGQKLLSSAGQKLLGGGLWRTIRFELRNALFQGHQPGGAGLRLCVRGPLELRIRRFSLRPVAPLLVIEPVVNPRSAPGEEHGPPDGAIDVAVARHELGCAYLVGQDFGVPSDDAEAPTRSPLRIYEDGRPLGPPHRVHNEIRAKGAGRYCFWNGTLYFSASDNTDPRTNGRSYTFRRSEPVRPPAANTPHQLTFTGRPSS